MKRPPALSVTQMPKVDSMKSWPAPVVPEISGRAPQLRLYDSADRQIRPVGAGETATMYVCGITPYDATHLGHAATYLAFDLVYRIWLDGGHRVHYVQNVTDVDDPLFERAQRDGIDWRELAERETQLFREDMAALRVLPPHDYVAATDAIAEVAEAVAELDGVSEVYSVAGDVDLIAVVRVREFEQIAEVIAGNISKTPGVLSTETHIAFRAYSKHDLEEAFAIGFADAD